MKYRSPLLLSVLAAALLSAAAPASAQTTTTSPTYEQWQTAWDFYRFWECADPRPWEPRRVRTVTLTETINAPIADVFAYYSDINNHYGHHSFLRDVVEHERYTRADGIEVRNFTAVEEIPLADGLSTLSNTHAQQRLDASAYYYETDTWTLPNVVTHQQISFESVAGDTRITEEITFEAHWSLIDFTVDGGVSAHTATLASIKAAFEAGEI